MANEVLNFPTAAEAGSSTVINRVVRALLTQCGLDPDEGFPGFRACAVLDAESGVVSPQHEWGYAARYGVVAGADCTDELQNCVTSAEALGVPVVLDGGTYLVSGTITGSSAHIVCRGPVTIKRSDAATETAIQISGTIGTFSDVDDDIDYGSNIIECAALAPSLVKGDLIQIKSSSIFADSRPQGEIHMVRDVDGDFIYLSETILDDNGYTVANTAQIAKVTPGEFQIIGKLILDRTPPAVTDEVQGIDVIYCKAPSGFIELRGVTSSGLSVRSCYRPDFRVVAYDHAIQDPGASSTGEGQPIIITGSTMYGKFQGFGSYVRHAVSMGAVPAYHGVPWENHITDFIGVGGGDASVFDAHGPTGSVYYEGCVALGGTISDPVIAATVPTAGFHLAARRNYIRGCRVVGCAAGASVRSDNTAIGVYDIDGLELQDIGDGGGFSFNQAGVTISHLRVRNVRGSVSSTTPLISIVNGTVEQWTFEDLHNEAGELVLVSSSATVPAKFRVSRGSSRFSSAQATNVRAIDITNDGITTVQLYDIYSEAGEMFRTTVALDLLELNTCSGADAFSRYVRVEANIGNLSILGGEFDDAQNAGSALVSVSDGAVITNAEIAPSRVTGANLVRAISGTAGESVTRAKFGGSLGSITTLVNGAVLGVEVVAGSFEHPRMLRGTGSPDTVVTAPLSCVFQRDDGSAGTLLYANDDGSTSWTAYA